MLYTFTEDFYEQHSAFGYIGSHTAVELVNTGYNVVIVDDLSNSREDVIDRIEKITGYRPSFYKFSCSDYAAMDKIFAEHNFSAVIHFAGYKAVGESVEKPNGIPNNLMPYITQVAKGLRDKLNIFGNDYPTHDGTGVRDYIHVVDLAKGHVRALNYAEKHIGFEAINLGTGTGYSVLDIVKAFEKTNNLTIPFVFAPRRDGDLAAYFSNPSKAQRLLGWQTEKTLEDMCRDSWRWQKFISESR